MKKVIDNLPSYSVEVYQTWGVSELIERIVTLEKELIHVNTMWSNATERPIAKANRLAKKPQSFGYGKTKE